MTYHNNKDGEVPLFVSLCHFFIKYITEELFTKHLGVPSGWKQSVQTVVFRCGGRGACMVRRWGLSSSVTTPWENKGQFLLLKLTLHNITCRGHPVYLQLLLIHWTNSIIGKEKLTFVFIQLGWEKNTR